MKKILFVSILLFTMHTAAQTDSLSFLNGFDKFADSILTEWKVPGAAVAVVWKGKPVLLTGYGLRNKEKNLAVTPKTLFAIASCTKAFTTTTMASLVDSGLMKWDNPVINYLPDFHLDNAYITATITPRDLVSHRSGYPRHDFLWYGSNLSRNEIVSRMKFLPATAGIREKYQYNNLMYVAAGAMMERISGKTWEQLVSERLLIPLQMNRTNFDVRISALDADAAQPYKKFDEVVTPVSFLEMCAAAPCGGINSTVEDMANWLIMNLSKGKFYQKQLISENALLELRKPVIVSGATITYEELFYSLYGLGWGMSDYRGELRITHGGNIDGFSSLVTMLPDKEFGIVVLTNMSGNPVPGILSFNLVDRFLNLSPVDWHARNIEVSEKAKAKELTEAAKRDSIQKKGTIPDFSNEQLAGIYKENAYGEITVREQNGALSLSYNRFSTELRHYHYNIYECVDSENFEKVLVHFIMGNDGNVAALHIQMEPSFPYTIFTKADK